MTITREEIEREVKKHYDNKKGVLVFKNPDGTKTFHSTSDSDPIKSATDFICQCLNV